MTQTRNPTVITGVRRDPRVDAQRFDYVLEGLVFPAAKWQVIGHAEHYGADALTRAALWALPVGVYPNLPALLRTLGIRCVPPAGA